MYYNMSIVKYILYSAGIKIYVYIIILGLNRFTNKTKGDYYGQASTWFIKKKKMGVFRPKKAPPDISGGRGEANCTCDHQNRNPEP